MTLLITKASGEKEPFSIEKFRKSLHNAGIDNTTIDQLAAQLQQHTNINSTYDVYRFAFEELKKKRRAFAARYKLRESLMELGPSGFPFEKFIAEIFKQQGYATKTDQVLQGKCIPHEIDLIAINENKHIIAECKFHNTQILKTDVKVTLYVKARFEDIQKELPATSEAVHEIWVITNTQFTKEAIQYSLCAQIKLLGWKYPYHGNIAELVNKYKLYPITALTTLSEQHKQDLIKEGFVLCRDVEKHIPLLHNLSDAQHSAQEIINEAKEVCQI